MPVTVIPIIDFAGAFSSDAGARRRVAREVRGAAMGFGFFYAVNHGVPAQLVERQLDYARRFFALPAAEKMALSLKRSKCRRGYESVGDQTLDLSAKPDLKESYYCGIDHPEDHPFVQAGYDSYGVSFWPQSLPGFREQMNAYMAAQQALCERIMHLIALSLDLEESYFDYSFRDPLVTLRLAHYPPHPADAPGDLYGAGAHTDWGSVTILLQDDLGGLEVQGPDGSWTPAPPVAGTFVVNLGDMMPRWTNGLFRSNLHRVINRNAAHADRYSVPYFYAPRYTARIEPVPTCVSPGRPAAYAPCIVGEHMAEMARKTYGADYAAG